MIKILIPIDFSCDIQPTIDYIQTFIPEPYKLVFVNVYQCNLDIMFEKLNYKVNDDQMHVIMSSISTDFQEKLNQMENIKYKYSGVGIIDTQILFAKDESSSKVICDYVEKNDFDLIVIASDKKRSFLGYVFTSFANDILTSCRIPTTVLGQK